MARYWLFNWLDQRSLTTTEEVIHELLSDAQTLDSFQEAAFEGEQDLTKPSSSAFSISVGGGLDLSGRLTCMSPDCRRADVDKLLRRAWFYFDTVVVGDVITHAIAYHWDSFE